MVAAHDWTQNFYKRTERNEAEDIAEIIKQAKHETVEIFTEDFKLPARKTAITFDARHYMDWMQPVLPLQLAALPKKEIVKLGDKEFSWFHMPMTERNLHAIGPCVIDHGTMRSRLSMGPRGSICRFDRPIYLPRITEKGDVWMSLTPWEVISQRPGLRKARGNVLIGGLGMAWFAKRVCERKEVKRVTVFDTDPSVIKAFKFEHPKLDAIVCGDIWTAPYHSFDSVLLDIWRGYGDANGTHKLLDLKAKHRNVWAWGDVEFTGRGGLW